MKKSSLCQDKIKVEYLKKFVEVKKVSFDVFKVSLVIYTNNCHLNNKVSHIAMTRICLPFFIHDLL